MFLCYFEEPNCAFFQLFFCFCRDYKVIHVVCKGSFVQQFSEDTCYYPLKCSWRVTQSKVHHFWFEQSFVCQKDCFLFITFFYLYVVVSPDQVQFVEVFCIFEFVDYFIDQGQWHFILDCVLIQLSIVLYQSQCSIFLWYEETQYYVS